MKENPITMNIIGCCTSRSAFSITKGGEIVYDIKAYIQRNSLFTLFYDVDSEYRIEQPEINDLLKHNFNRRMLCTTVNGDAPEQLFNRKGEWLLLDTHPSNFPCALIEYPNSKYRLVQSEYINEVSKLFERNNKFKDCKLTLIDASVNMSYNIEEVVKFLKENWGDKIILINLSRAFIEMDQKGVLKKHDSDQCLEGQQCRNKMAELLLNNLDCHYIEMPQTLIRTDQSSVHYISELRDYIKEMIDTIVKGSIDAKDINRIKAKYEIILGNILLGEWASEQNTIMRVDALIRGTNGVNIEHTICDLEGLVNREMPGAYGALARLYRTGTYFEKSLDKAADWMRKAADKNVGWAKNELFDILWFIETPKSYKEMISVATKFAEEGNGAAMGRLGRAYRHGKGVEQDLDKAADWMRKAADKNVGWAKNELFDILWSIGTPESYKEMISVATEFADKGDNGAMVRLGRTYRDGKGVEKDFDKALEWMRKASEKTWWRGRELVDNLLKSTKEEHHKEAFDVCSRLIKERNDGHAMGRLGRIYRDGKGVEKNLDKAAEWMRKAADKNVGWANNELSFLISEINRNQDKVSITN